MKVKRYTDEEIQDIKKWRSEGLTWAEISDRNGRSADAMQVKFSTLKRGVPEYKKQEIPPVIIPEGVSSFNERKTATETETEKTKSARLKRSSDDIKPIEQQKPKPFTVVDKISTGYILNLVAELRFDTLEEIRDFFHSDAMLLALVDDYSVTEESTVVIEGDFI